MAFTKIIKFYLANSTALLGLTYLGWSSNLDHLKLNLASKQQPTENLTYRYSLVISKSPAKTIHLMYTKSSKNSETFALSYLKSLKEKVLIVTAPTDLKSDGRNVVVSTDPARKVVTLAYKGLKLDISLDDLAKGTLTVVASAPENYYGINGDDFVSRYGKPPLTAEQGLLRNSGGVVAAGRQGDGGAPIVFTKDFGILIDSTAGKFAISGNQISFTGSTRPGLDVYFTFGSPKATMEAVSEISGRTPLPPKWTLGFMNSQWGTDEKTVKQIVSTYRHKHIPIDGFIMDFDYKAWGEDNYGELRWNSTSGLGNVGANKYPDGSNGLFGKQMNDRGIKLVGIMKPRLLTQGPDGSPSDAARIADKNHYWVAGREPYKEYFSGRLANDVDFLNPKARAWFWDHSKNLFKTGIEGWWNDEADEVSGFYFDSTQFGNMQRSFYDGQRSISDKRVWSINRNFFLGDQRYGYGLWSGDIDTGFASMAEQRVRMLASIDLGEINWSMDTGGFNGHPSPENYARWMEFASMVPIMRVHGTYGEQRQPWIYGDKAEAAATNAIKLRYSLIPYLYSMQREGYESGVGIVRPLFYEFPEDDASAKRIDSWMVGDSLLVAPVVDEGQTEKSIYLPFGNWFDYVTGEKIIGGREIVRKIDAANWSDIPIYIREGAILPHQAVTNFIGEKPEYFVQLDIFPGEKLSSLAYYDDDGETYGYEKDKFFRQMISTQKTTAGVNLSFASPTGSFAPSQTAYKVRIYGDTLIGPKGLKLFTTEEALFSSASEGYWYGKDARGDFLEAKVSLGTAKKLIFRRG